MGHATLECPQLWCCMCCTMAPFTQYRYPPHSLNTNTDALQLACLRLWHFSHDTARLDTESTSQATITLVLNRHIFDARKQYRAMTRLHCPDVTLSLCSSSIEQILMCLGSFGSSGSYGSSGSSGSLGSSGSYGSLGSYGSPV